ncbi:MAG TPA: hypothetical protein V6C69_03055 [Trichormus sp.]|jgi:hypothetical protein
MTNFDQDPTPEAIYSKAIRMAEAGISQWEYARLDDDGSIRLKIHEVDSGGINQHFGKTVQSGGPEFERIMREHALKSPGDSSVNERMLIDGAWRTLAESPKYRWAMLTQSGDVLVKLDEDSEQRFHAGSAEHADLCKEHNLVIAGDNSVIQIGTLSFIST